jgi:hypothetical protein
MICFVVLLALVALSCAHPRVREERCPRCEPCPEIRPGEHRLRIVTESVSLPAPPAPPALDKMPPGCPPQFMACYSPEQDAALEKYFQAVKDWAVKVYARGCAHGR